MTTIDIATPWHSVMSLMCYHWPAQLGRYPAFLPYLFISGYHASATVLV